MLLYCYSVLDKISPANAAPLRRVVYVLQEPLWEELDRIQKQHIIIPLDVDDETSEWYKSLVLVPRQMVRLGYAWTQFD